MSPGRLDHPRSRGVYAARRARWSRMAGSSPLARGLPRAGADRRARDRIIPARAGFTVPAAQEWRARRDHPRSRGVYATPTCGSAARGGSSPLARGLPWDASGRFSGSGIIPARAGFTARCTPTSHPGPDHPRSRGVYRWEYYSRGCRSGSSPLARGLPTTRSPHDRRLRIIPARAGFTPRPRRSGPPRRDHPRSRGVYPGKGVHMGRILGSSPLARGLRGLLRVRLGRLGIIPARAGVTRRASTPSSAASDHPRSRGVYRDWRAASPPSGGSSPLARGLRVAAPGARGVKRIIPARAGFTRGASRGGWWPADHPRSRGVYRHRSDGDRHGCGSSPLARGLRA